MTAVDIRNGETNIHDEEGSGRLHIEPNTLFSKSTENCDLIICLQNSRRIAGTENIHSKNI